MLYILIGKAFELLLVKKTIIIHVIDMSIMGWSHLFPDDVHVFELGSRVKSGFLARLVLGDFLEQWHILRLDGRSQFS